MLLKDRVLLAIERAGCTIPDVAAAAKIKPPSVHGWTNGESQSLRAGPCLRAAAFLGVNPLWLAEGEGDMLPKHSAPSAEVLHINETRAEYKAGPIADLVQCAKRMSRDGQLVLLGRAEEIAARYPIQTKQAKS